MKRLWMCVAVVVALALGGAAQAGSPVRSSVSRNYQTTYGTRFSDGYYYTGRNHAHWSHRVWDRRYQRYLYYDPYVRSYYYWYEGHNRFYPVTYVPVVVVRPTVVEVPALPPTGP
jgi:hypothetical protein